ncbi:carboxypeptidase N subunit 2 [Biomphalaria pfeifferi]|uniref:Carboxypeptidase N subunit 2 n=1 Tax=Biomphalaria pfeifferi TaxID=112525 RepID=A0AAD8F4V3_BIOPF|nr:carboxypeptidase N subunit 2 [Biomphalaria pfeifferi]
MLPIRYSIVSGGIISFHPFWYKSSSGGLSILFFILTFVSVASAQACPPSCFCFVGDVICRKGPLMDIFTQMKSDTVNLTLDNIKGLQIINPSRMKELSVDGSLLVKIRIVSCYVQDVEARTFEKFPNLKELDLSNNEITIIRADAFLGLSYLMYLNLSHNRLSNVAGIFNSLSKLKTLDISWNFIKNLTSEAFVLQDILTSLKLDGNPLKTLHGSSFRSLFNLKELRARECSLTDVGKDVFAFMPSLVLIDLGLNRLKEAPHPEVFSKHHYLRTLILYHNVIEVLFPDNFVSPGLYAVDLSSNRINKIDHLAFRRSGIRKLDLSHNSIISLDPPVLKELSTSVTHLNLTSNPLRILSPGLFSDLQSLECLNISKCSLEEFNVEAFESLGTLAQLDISHNELHFLPEGAFKLFNKISSITLEQNSWECDCKIKPFRDWLVNKDRPTKLQCLNGGLNDTECSRLMCIPAHATESKEISMLTDSELSECHSESSSNLAAGTQGAIVASCMGFAIILLLFAIFLWRKGQTGQKLKRICVPSEAESSHVIDEDSKIPPLANCDRNSLTHSDHNFVFRHYFDHLTTNMDEIETTDEDELAQGEADPLKQKDSLYSSEPSLYSHPTEAAYGMESTV